MPAVSVRKRTIVTDLIGANFERNARGGVDFSFVDTTGETYEFSLPAEANNDIIEAASGIQPAAADAIKQLREGVVQ